MIVNKKQVLGVTLLEIILVLAIGAAILLLSLRQYESFRADSDLQQVQYDINKIFAAMSEFYKVNCYGTYNPNVSPPNPPLQAGALNPMRSSAPPNPYPINMTTDLITKGYLTQKPALNPLIDASTGAGTDGYILQFNEYHSPKYACLTTAPCASPVQVGTIVIWKPQVAILLKDSATAQQYLDLLTGDCLSTASGNTVQPCTPGNKGTGNYVVWERLPSLSSSEANSTLWMMNPLVKQFTSMYNTYPLGTLTGGQLPNNQTQYFLCGG